MVVRLPELKKYLNRDGLEVYNSLLPHSSTEIEEYVGDWLDAHPEATTTVQDGSITAQKLADGSVTRNKLAADVAHLLGGMMLTKEVQDEILTADDAYSVAPLNLIVNGKSIQQSGTPTPTNPIPIESIEVLNLPIVFAGKNLLDRSTESSGYIRNDGATGISNDWLRSAYIEVEGDKTYTFNPNSTSGGSAYGACYDANEVFIEGSSFNSGLATFTTPINAKYVRVSYRVGSTNVQLERGSIATKYMPYVEPILVEVPMQGNILRSVPSGFVDELRFTYISEGTIPNYGLYSVSIYKRIGSILIKDANISTHSSGDNFKFLLTPNPSMNPGLGQNSFMCDSYSKMEAGGINANMPSDTIRRRGTSSQFYNLLMIRDSSFIDSSVASYKESRGNIQIDYLLANAQNIDLGTFELPYVKAPSFVIYSDPTTGLKMSYMRDANIVISDIEQAIADL